MLYIGTGRSREEKGKGGSEGAEGGRTRERREKTGTPIGHQDSSILS